MLWSQAAQRNKTPEEAVQSFLTVSMTHSAWRRNRGRKPLPGLTAGIPAAGWSCHFQPRTPTEREGHMEKSQTPAWSRGKAEGGQKVHAHRTAATREAGRAFTASAPFSLGPDLPDYATFCVKSSRQHHLALSICLTTAGLQATGTLQRAAWEVCCWGVRSEDTETHYAPLS